MKKNLSSYFVWFVVLVVSAIFLFWLLGLQVSSRVAQGGQAQNDTPINNAPGDVSSSSERMVLNSDAHYRIMVPDSWYVERSGATALALYPDYVPQAGAVPSCKIEISALSNRSNLKLNDWLAAYLHQDPTEDIVEISQSSSRVSGRDAITWTGALNNVSTTLTYVLGNGSVYEFVPSEIGNSQNDCQDSLETILKNFTIISQ